MTRDRIPSVGYFNRRSLETTESDVDGIAILTIFGVGKLLTIQGRKKLRDRLSEPQTAESSPATDNATSVRRAIAYKELLTTFDDNILNLWDSFESSVKKNPQANCLGYRPRTDAGVGPYTFISYSDVKDRVVRLASGLSSIGLQEDAPIGIFAINRVEWVLTDLAAIYNRYPVVALYESVGPDAVSFILDHSGLSTVVLGIKQVPALLTVIRGKQFASLKNLIIMDESITSQQKEELQSFKLKVYTLQEILEAGKEVKEKAILRPQHLYSFVYTSGTKGSPKAAIQTHSCMIAQIAGVRAHLEEPFSGHVHMSYLPLAQVFERSAVHTMLSLGATVAFYQGSINELFQDISALKPTFLVGVPRVWGRIREKVLRNLEKQGSIKRKFFEYAYAAKQAAIADGSSTPIWDALLFNQFKSKLGGRVRFVLSAAAPLDPKLGDFIRICFGCEVIQGYGLTETNGGITTCVMGDRSNGQVGRILPCCEIKLVDVPDYGYFAKEGKGEIAVRGPTVFRGYYKDPEKTKASIDSEGFFYTGDIGEWNKNGTLSIIDRKKNIFKISQGEYIAPEYLEEVYSRSPFVDQIWVSGSSLKRHLVAIVYPESSHLIQWAKDNNLTGDIDQLRGDERVKKAILADIHRVGGEAKVHGFETIKEIEVVGEGFKKDERFLTATCELNRFKLNQHFASVIRQLYENITE
ncbi:fatty acyl-CoA synthetase [Planoprotostelium fungivorum]|uniref:Fatty acyl-CoA synthetase n=1 Tax=Planoprotostelium fungivorum TaxID=1890364 RepID=A0A2P6NSC5_9EUKA|nr:fatty acyl-CoA synthetase [Planoprotostelium fungivorum]